MSDQGLNIVVVLNNFNFIKKNVQFKHEYENMKNISLKPYLLKKSN